MKTSEELLEKIKEKRDTIKKFGVKRLGLFGSYAKSKPKKSSDIDILVEFEEGKKTFDNYMELKFYLEELLGTPVDLVISETIKPALRPYILAGVRYAPGL